MRSLSSGRAFARTRWHRPGMTDSGLLRGVCHRAARSLSSGARSRDPLAPTRWLAMTISNRRIARLCLAAGGGAGRWLILVAPPQPVHRVRQALFVTAERRQVEVVIGGIHHVEAAREAGIGVEDISRLVAIEHADAGRFLD